jgi:hypothetical protein
MEYLKCKIENPKKIVLVQSGNFFQTFDEDAIILELIFGYKITFSNQMKIGFPISNITKVKLILDKEQIDYCVLPNNEDKNFGNDNYLKFKQKTLERYQYIKRYQEITEKLLFFISKDNFEKGKIHQIYTIVKE